MRRRLLLGYLGLTLIVLVAFGVPLGVIWTSKLHADELSSLATSATDLAKGTAAPLSAGLDRDGGRGGSGGSNNGSGGGGGSGSGGAVLTPAALDSIRAQLGQYRGQYREVVALLDPSGRPFASEGPLAAAAAHVLRAAALARTSAGATVTGQATVDGRAVLYAAAPVVTHASTEHSPTPVAGITLVADDATITDARVRNVVLALLGLGLLGLVLAALAGAVLVRSLVRPLQRIQAAVALIGSGNLGARAPTEDVPDELARLADTVNTMALRLGELISAQRAFVADASHQLRTPLTALRLRLENLTSGAPVDPDDQAGILTEVDRLARLVTGLLALARAEEAPPAPVEADVTAVVQGRALAWQPVAAEQGVELSAAPSPPLPARIIPDDLEQALDNLVDNALKVTPAGGAVRLSLHDEGAFVVLHVADDGPGMSAEDRAHAFDRFWSNRAERSTGSGLGLSIVDRLVRNMGGDVELRSAPGHGLDAIVRVRKAR